MMFRAVMCSKRSGGLCYLWTNKRKEAIKMTDRGKALPIGQIDNNRIKAQLSYHNAFRQMRPARAKYKLSCNEMLVLNGLVLYSYLINSTFTINGAVRFVGYLNDSKIRYYITALIGKGYINIHRTSGRVVYYRLSVVAFEVINDTFDGYDKRQRAFCEKFNISL